MKTSLKLNYSTFETSFNGFIISFLILLCCGGIPFAFILAYPDTLSRIFTNIMAAIWFVILILSICLPFIISVYCFIKGCLKSANNLIKSMEFDTNGIHINFKDKMLNCAYNYSDIKKLEIKLYTINLPSFNTSTYRGGLNTGLTPQMSIVGASSYKSNVMIKDIEISVIDTKGICYSINVSKIQLFDTNMHNLLYDLRFFIQFVPEFSYSFIGPVEDFANNILDIN